MAKSSTVEEFQTDAEIELARSQDVEALSFQDLLDAGVIEITEVDDVEQVDKEKLIGKPLIIFDWVFKESEIGEYVVVRAKTQEGNVVFADGSTGVRDQLAKYQRRIDKGAFSGLYVPHGLRASTYQTKDEQGRTITATTYYIDNRRD